MAERKSSLEWALKYSNGDRICDPDGWDRSHLKQSLLEKITEEEFLTRCSQSSTRGRVRNSTDEGNHVWMKRVLEQQDDAEKDYSFYFPYFAVATTTAAGAAVLGWLLYF